MILKVLENGTEILNRQIPSVSLKAGKDTVLNIQSYLPRKNTGKEYLLNISFRLKSDKNWARAGFEIASNQFPLSGLPVSEKFNPEKGKLNFTHQTDLLLVGGKGFSITFDKKSGALCSYVFQGKEQVFSPVLPGFTRPLTDNDERGWKPQILLKEWYESKPRLKSFIVQKETSGEIIMESIYEIIEGKANVQVNYTVNAQGIVKVNYALKVSGSLPNIPKVGMTCGIADDFRQISWYGRGPLENYIDRRAGFETGIFSLPIDQFMEPYAMPQENGNRTDVRWMYLANKHDQGLLIVADSLLSMSAWPYSEAAINKAKHTNELKESGFVTLNIDLIQMGVGGNNSWTDLAAPVEKYQIKAKDYQYSFFLVPTKMKVEQLAKKWQEIKY